MQTLNPGSLMQSTYASRMRKPAELMLVPMIDIFTVLVTFLLMTAVFARITVLNLDLDVASADNSTPSEPEFRLEVIVRKESLELTNGTVTIATIPNVDGGYDLKTLSEAAVSLKRDYPQTDNASVLLEPDVEYDSLVQVMDAIRTVEATSVPGAEALAESGPGAGDAKPIRVDLFPNIAVGEAP